MANNILEILSRIKELKGLKTDREVASFLGMTKTALSNHKTRGTIPYEKISTACELLGVYLDWLLTGESPKYRKKILTGERSGEEEDIKRSEADEAERKFREIKREVLKSSEPLLATHNQDKQEFIQFINQVFRIYSSGNENARSKLRIVLAVLDPGTTEL